MTPETPQSFEVRTECVKAAFDNGFRRELGEEKGWARFQSTTVPGDIWLAGAGMHGPWFLALDHAGVAAALDRPEADMSGPGLARYSFASLTPLYGVLRQVYQLAASLPDAPLEAFRGSIRKLPASTEAERLVIQRVGQDIFRQALLDFWDGACAVTGVRTTPLLRASHIIPWAECGSDAERLNVYNGLLLAAHLDAAFDAHLISFDETGRMLFSPLLPEDDCRRLGLDENMRLRRSPARLRKRLKIHRQVMSEKAQEG